MGFEDRALVIAKANSGSPDSLTPWKHQFEKGYPYNIGFLSAHTIVLSTHFQTGAPASLCNKMYYGDGDYDLRGEPECEDCEKPGYQGKGKNRPTCVFCGLGWVFDLVDKEGESASGKKFKENPRKIIEVSGGKGQANFDGLNQALAAEEPYLAFTHEGKQIWRMKRMVEGGMIAPYIVPSQEIKSLKLKLDSLTPDILEGYSIRSRGEVQGTILSAYSNLRKDLLEPQGFIFPAANGEDAEGAPAKDNLAGLED